MSMSYRHIASTGYDLPQSLVNVWLSCGIFFQSTYDIETDAGANALVYWWMVDGHKAFPGARDIIDADLVKELHLDRLPGKASSHQHASLDRQDSTSASEDVRRQPLTPLLVIIWQNRPDLRRTIDIGNESGITQLWQWWLKEGVMEYPVRPSVVPSNNTGNDSKDFRIKTAAKPIANSSVCLVGYPRGEFGLGEDIRTLRASMQLIGINPAVIRAPWEITARQNIREPFIEADLAKFDVDVIFYVMPAFDTMTLFNKVGPKAFTARRRIGFWQWELDHFPKQALAAFDLVDEIWCHSSHAGNAFRRATDKPVYKVPLPVSFPDPINVSRSALGLPANSFIFFTSFDGASFIARKNPLATILAFQDAFPSRLPDVSLVIKAMNVNNNELWRECLRKAGDDKRIIVVEEVMDHNVYYQLLRNCDAVVSLHRAEGFGRLMAEAMTLGIPVIASRYSGNLDFMNEENSWLIGGDMISVLPGDYPFHLDQKWFEPRVADAAGALRECVAKDEKRRRFSENAKREIQSRYSLEACGAAYLELLNGNRQ